MKFVFALALSAGLVSGSGLALAQAAWPVVQTGQPTVSYDPASVSWQGRVVSFNAKALFAPAVSVQNSAGQTVAVASMTEKMSIDCGAQTYVDHGNTGYDASGAAVYSEGMSGPKPVAAGTPSQSLAQALCK